MATAGSGVVANSTPNLLPGITTGTYSDPLRGVAPNTTAYYFNGNRYLDANQANQAAQEYTQQQQTQATGGRAQSVEPYVGEALPAGTRQLATDGFAAETSGAGGYSGPAANGGTGGATAGAYSTPVYTPSLPPPSNLVATGATFGPNGTTTNYGENPDAAAARDLKGKQDAATLSDANRQKALAEFQAAMGQFTGSGPASGPSEADLTTAAANQYSLAKDRVGARRASALAQFQDLMAGRGLQGSTIEGAGAGSIFSGANDELESVDVGQANDAIGRARAVQDQRTQINADQRRQALASLASFFSGGGY